MTLAPVARLGPARLLVTDRHGGSSRGPWSSLNLADHVGDDPAAVQANRNLAAAEAGADRVAVIRAEHGSTVHRLSTDQDVPVGDALVTTEPGLALMALSADCVAGAIVAPDVRAAAVFHCGWRGLPAGVVPATVAALRELGAAADQLLVRLGPAICANCYEVSAEVRDEVAEVVPASRATSRRGRPAIDLAAGVCAQLRDAGCRTISTDPRCTAEHEDLFSYRAEGVTGRQGVLVVLGVVE